MSRSQLALARRYRPQNFQEVVGQEATLRALMSALDNQRLHHAYLLTGTRGVGKTTLARLFAKALNCEQGISSTPCNACETCQGINSGAYVDLIEVDAASRTKVEDTRELLENVQYLPTKGRFKIYLIDEVHMLSGHSFNALLKTLEEPPSHVKFLLATTDPQKLPVTVLSRCLQFHLRRLPFSQIVNHLAYVLKAENLDFEAEALEVLARAADGSMRDALSLLDQAIAYGHGRVLTAEVRVLLGLTEKGRLIALFSALVAKDAKKVLQEIKAIADTSPDFSSVLNELGSLIHQIAIAQRVPEAIDDEGTVEPKSILDFANSTSPEEIQLYYQIALMGQRDLPYAPTPQMGFEMIMLRMMAFQPVSFSKKLSEKSEKNVSAGPTVSEVSEVSKISAISKGPADSSVSAVPSVSSVFEAPSVSTPTLPEFSEWAVLIPALNLSGITKELANHCTVIHWTEDHIHLSLKESQKPLLSKRNEEHLQKMISQHYNKPISVKISVGLKESSLKGKTNLQNTPAEQHQKAKDLATQKAQHLIETDPNVGQILQRFSAKIEHVSAVSENVEQSNHSNDLNHSNHLKNVQHNKMHGTIQEKELVNENDLPWEEA